MISILQGFMDLEVMANPSLRPSHVISLAFLPIALNIKWLALHQRLVSVPSSLRRIMEDETTPVDKLADSLESKSLNPTISTHIFPHKLTIQTPAVCASLALDPPLARSSSADQVSSAVPALLLEGGGYWFLDVHLALILKIFEVMSRF